MMRFLFAKSYIQADERNAPLTKVPLNTSASEQAKKPDKEETPKKRVYVISRETSRILSKAERSSSAHSFSSLDRPVKVSLKPPPPFSFGSSSNSKPLAIYYEEIPASKSSELGREMSSGRVERPNARQVESSSTPDT